MRMVHLKRIAAVAAAAGLLLAVAATPARAIPIAGDYSLIDVTSTKGLSSLSVTLTALGTAEIFNSAALGVKLVLLPVTGGDVDLPTSFLGTIEHSGSGLRLSSFGSDIDLTDFVMNTSTLKMSANFAIGALTGATDIFDILPCDSGPPGTCATFPGGAVLPTALRLSFTADAAALVALAFGNPAFAGLAGVQFGVANTALTAVPEPGTAFLVGSALVGLAALRRNHRA